MLVYEKLLSLLRGADLSVHPCSSGPHRPVFSAELDSNPIVRDWLASLDDDTREGLRDDRNHTFKEFAGGEGVGESRDLYRDAMRDPEGPAPVDVVLDEALALLRNPRGLDGDLRARLCGAAGAVLPRWQLKCFVPWIAGARQRAIAMGFGISEAAVHYAIHGNATHRGGKGQVGALQRLGADPTIRKMVVTMAKASLEKQQRLMDERLLHWFAAIPPNKPELIEPLACLLVLDALADARDEVPLATLIRHFPRSRITPCLTLLRAYAYAASDGRVVKIHRRPEAKA